MKGVDTSPEVVAEFRAHYLYSGNASESARQVGIHDRTGREIATRLQGEADFADARRALRAQALEELVAMRMRVARTALERLEADLPIPEVGEGGVVNVIDKRSDYGKLVLDAEKNAHNLARFDAEKNGEVAGQRDVRITVSGPAELATCPPQST